MSAPAESKGALVLDPNDNCAGSYVPGVEDQYKPSIGAVYRRELSQRIAAYDRWAAKRRDLDDSVNRALGLARVEGLSHD